MKLRVVKSSSLPVRFRKTVSMAWEARRWSIHWGSWIEPSTIVALDDWETEGENLEALDVGRTTCVIEGDERRRGTSSEPMWPEPDVRRTCDMMGYSFAR